MTKMQEYVIVIGGSKSHVPFIECSQKLGYQTIVFDIDPNCMGAQISNTFYKISTYDIDKIIFMCNEINKDKKVIGIFTYCSAFEPLFAVAKITEKLGLRSFSVESVRIANNKGLMKQCFSASGLNTPDCAITSHVSEANDFINRSNRPVIMKPLSGSQGSKGVALIDERVDIQQYFKIAQANSIDSKVLLETYHSGREFSVDGIVVGDTPIVLSVSEKFNLGAKHNFTMSGFSLGKIANEDKILLKAVDKINEVGKQAATAMGISNSFFSADVLLTNEGLVILECGVLLDCKIDRLLKAADVNIYELFINMITGKDIVTPKLNYTKGYGLSFIFSYHVGKLLLSTGKDLSRNNIVEWESSDGDIVYPPKSIADILGWAISSGEDANIAYENSCNAMPSGFFEVVK
jgi:phosphoribosylamine-glycine ligase